MEEDFLRERELVYGIDWCKTKKLNASDASIDVVACSFYDHVLDIYSYNMCLSS